MGNKALPSGDPQAIKPAPPSAKTASPDINRASELIHQMAQRKARERAVREEAQVVRRDLKGIKDLPENEQRRRVLKLTLEELEARREAASEENRRMSQETLRWLSQHPDHPIAYFEHIAGTEGVGAGNAGRLLSGYWDNEALEVRLLSELAAPRSEHALLVALSAVETRATAERLSGVSAIAQKIGTERSQAEATRIVAGYKSDPDAVQMRTQAFSVLVDVLQKSAAPTVRFQALQGLVGEKSAAPQLKSLVLEISQKDSDGAVRALAGQIVDRWSGN